MRTRSEIYYEVARLDRELTAARATLRDAQTLARVTGVKMAGHEYAALWDRVHQINRALETAKLADLAAQETAADRLIGILRNEHPEVFALIASRAGVE
jgi:hypothetical protein